MKKILFIAGTRPEAIKLAPLYLEMKTRLSFEPVFCDTGQHADLLQHGLAPFGITPDISLTTMHAGQGLTNLVGKLFTQLGNVLQVNRPDMVIVQGDTVSAFAGGWSSFYERIPVAHLEAGLRTGNLEHPFPEEATRRALSIVTTVHFAPTSAARDNLLAEGTAPESIVVTGNTAVDALFRLMDANLTQPESINQKRRILVTGHRRENFGRGMQNLCEALIRLADEFPEIEITYAMHPNPAVKEPVKRMLENRKNIHLIGPQEYGGFVKLMAESTFIISDSGGMQEEAPALGKPVLVTRRVTERPEAEKIGATRLVGTEIEAILAAARELLTDDQAFAKMAGAGSPYGDGRAAVRICDWLEGKPIQEFGLD